MADIALELVDLPVVELGLALEVRGCGGLGRAFAGRRRRRRRFDSDVAVEVKECVQTNGVEQEGRAADDEEVRVAPHVDAGF